MPIIAYLGTTINEYRKTARQKLKELKICCPKHPEERMKAHARYLRKIKETGEEISIQRLICHTCGTTVSILPDFLLPNKHYSASEIESVMMQHEGGTAVYDIDTPAGVCTVRRWLSEIPEKAAEWVSKLKSLTVEKYRCPISESALSGLPLMEQIRQIGQKLPKIMYSGNLLGYAGIYVQSHMSPVST